MFEFEFFSGFSYVENSLVVSITLDPPWHKRCKLMCNQIKHAKCLSPRRNMKQKTMMILIRFFSLVVLFAFQIFYFYSWLFVYQRWLNVFKQSDNFSNIARHKIWYTWYDCWKEKSFLATKRKRKRTKIDWHFSHYKRDTLYYFELTEKEHQLMPICGQFYDILKIYRNSFAKKGKVRKAFVYGFLFGFTTQ